MSTKLVIGLVMIIGVVALLPQNVFAHVLISDDMKSIGTIFHVVPDDDPVAGRQTDLFFDIQTQNINKENAKLAITNAATQETDDVTVIVEGSSVTARYTFRTQGVYRLSLVVTSDKTYTFHYSQRVSRGVVGNITNKPSFPLATFALVFSGAIFLLLSIVFFNNRKAIKEHSTF